MEIQTILLIVSIISAIVAIINSFVAIVTLGLLFKTHKDTKIDFKYGLRFCIGPVEFDQSKKGIHYNKNYSDAMNCLKHKLFNLGKTQLKHSNNHSELMNFRMEAFKDVKKQLILKKASKSIEKWNLLIKPRKWTMDKMQFYNVETLIWKEMVIVYKKVWDFVIEEKQNYWVFYLLKKGSKISKKIEQTNKSKKD